MPKRDGTIRTREQRFARLVAQGVRQGDAYRLTATQPRDKTKKRAAGDAVNGCVMAHYPTTRAEVANTLEQLMPIGTMREELMFCMRNLKGLAFAAEDERVRLMATLKLYEICEKREALEIERSKSDRQRLEVIADLQGLYRKALEPVVEAVAEEPDEPALELHDSIPPDEEDVEVSTERPCDVTTD